MTITQLSTRTVHVLFEKSATNINKCTAGIHQCREKGQKGNWSDHALTFVLSAMQIRAISERMKMHFLFGAKISYQRRVIKPAKI